ncbi:hypothetical protein J2S34_001855 [Nitrobacter winogradskyi]|uniref:Uncharacterized protein n=1 Tax=Nitrobacter winogradskyi TaxID=913 RepID=A0ACC6AJP2_NITWI|nr:hypothetical protein [Nitrobacter winogradskyi]
MGCVFFTRTGPSHRSGLNNPNVDTFWHTLIRPACIRSICSGIMEREVAALFHRSVVEVR